jgi:hypothetical protein
MSPLAKKLQIKPGQRWLIMNAPETFIATLDPLPEKVELLFNDAREVDGIQLFVKNSSAVAEALDVLKPVLKPDTILWIMYPKKGSGIKTDLSMMSNWDQTAKHGLRPVASAAIDETWSALRFRPESLVKSSGTRNAAIRQTDDYSAFIDVDAKQITLPPIITAALAHEPQALDALRKLSYSNKKEYVIWILSAKQEKTQTDRLARMTKMLLEGKKNPSAK